MLDPLFILLIRCSGGDCVSVNILCDHFQDCPDGDDEDCCKFISNYLSLRSLF